MAKITAKTPDEEFVDYCYLSFLGRAADELGKLHFLQALKNQSMDRQQVLLTFLESEEYRQRNNSLEFVPAGHWYSAVPSMADRKKFLEGSSSSENLPGIRANESGQFELLDSFREYCDPCPFPAKKTDGFRYHFENPQFSYTDGFMLYCMMRHLSPKRIIEVGCGYSSSVMMDTNDLFYEGGIDLTFIEPYPKVLLSMLTAKTEKKYSIFQEKVQDVDLGLFRSLEANDILFIDSTHVAKLGSDVNRILFEILPILKKGVVIHFHDIFWPFEYPKGWIREGRAWNEVYFLRAFLSFNDSFEILISNSFVHQKHADWFAKNMPICLENTGASIWLMKTSDSEG